MDQTSSSKVTVEYFDPYNVFQLLSPGLLPRLPLRNLHWESHAGPLRSIQTLHVDLVPAQSIRHSEALKGAELSRIKSNESMNEDGFKTQSLASAMTNASENPKVRRHQIPGLHQTPYLKVFFLRCDDNETYKTSARKKVREWIKEHVPSTDSAANEGHDAFEWLIVHIVVPNTAASTQPKSAAKGSTPLLEKLKNDFNRASKHSVDRVAQIRIGINDVPYDLLPRVVPAIPGSYNETPKEHQETWIDLIGKLKALILAAFDMRVSQYEENIKEKDGQRSLPGWNFCTFFMLKESLARGFESVGLVEDALVGYDELSIMLEAFCREQASSGSGVAFLSYTHDLRLLLETTCAIMLQHQSQESQGGSKIQPDEDPTNVELLTEIPISAYKKNYRELVLANNISIFDFRCYMFSRQLTLLLRLANATISKEQLLAKLTEQQESMTSGVAPRTSPATDVSGEAENLVLLAQVCQRALEFMTSIVQTMRQDLNTMESGKYDTAIVHNAIENIVASFSFSVAQQILAQTSTKSLPISDLMSTPYHIAGQPSVNKVVSSPPAYPIRSTSLMAEATEAKISANTGSSTIPGLHGHRSVSVHESRTSLTDSTSTKAGIEDLARHRAETYLLSRNLLQNLGFSRNWYVGWNAVQEESGLHMTEISLCADTPENSNATSQPTKSNVGVSNASLQSALSSKSKFYQLYERLTDTALRHFNLAGHKQSAQSAMSDLAVLRYYLKDHAAAASYFYRMTPSYGDQGWDLIEVKMLIMYCECLKGLDRVEEYAKVVLKLLTTVAEREKELVQSKTQLDYTKFDKKKKSEIAIIEGYLPHLIDASNRLKRNVNIPLQGIFARVEVISSILLSEGKDSFGVRLTLHYLLPDALTADSIRVRLTPVHKTQARDIWLESSEVVNFNLGTVGVEVFSNVVSLGVYTVQEIILMSGNLVFAHVEDEVSATSQPAGQPFLISPRLQIFQQPESIDVQLTQSRNIHLLQPQAMEICIYSGWNDIVSGELQVRAASAGMRLKISECSVAAGAHSSIHGLEGGVVKFDSLSSKTTLRLRIPFNIETDMPEVFVKVDLSYTTAYGTFSFGNQLHVSCRLPLGASVIDNFKAQSLLSKFSIVADTSTPLFVVGSKLVGSNVFDIVKGGNLKRSVPVFGQQLATVLYKIRKRPLCDGRGIDVVPSRDTTLSLSVSYIMLADQIREALRKDIEGRLISTDLSRYTRLIVKIAVHEFMLRSSASAFQKMVLCSEMRTEVVKNVDWTAHLQGMGTNSTTGRAYAEYIDTWLKGWTTSSVQIRLLPIMIDDIISETARRIVIPVTIPSVTAIHTADLIFDVLTNHTRNASHFVVTKNQAISATLRVQTSRAWDLAVEDEEGSDISESLQFYYELTAPTEHYLIGGKRKGHFCIPFSATSPIPTFTFPVLLIPIKEGYLPFPQLDIHAVQPIARPKSKGSTSSGRQGISDELVTCEVDYRAAGYMFRVVNGNSRSTFSLDASGPQGGAWLVGSESV